MNRRIKQRKRKESNNNKVHNNPEKKIHTHMHEVQVQYEIIYSKSLKKRLKKD